MNFINVLRKIHFHPMNNAINMGGEVCEFRLQSGGTKSNLVHRLLYLVKRWWGRENTDDSINHSFQGFIDVEFDIEVDSTSVSVGGPRVGLMARPRMRFS